MAKGRAKTEWLDLNEVKDILDFYIRREQKTVEKDNDIYYNIKAELNTGYTDRLAFQNPNQTPYYILSIYLRERGIENNISDFAEALMTQAYNSIIKHLKIERFSIFSQFFSMDMFMKLNRFIIELNWEMSGIYGGDRIEGSISRFSIWNIDNNKKISYLFYHMENKGLVVPNWQNILEKRGIAHTKRGKQLKAKDLNSALDAAKLDAKCATRDETKQKYRDIELFVENL